MKKAKRFLSILLTIGMLAAQLVAVHAEAEPEKYIKELIFEQNFDDEGKVNYSTLTYSAAPKTAGEFCLNGRTPSFDTHTSETDLCMTAPRVAADGYDYLVFTAPKALTGKYEIIFDFYASGDDGFYVIGGGHPMVGKVYQAGTWNTVTMELDFVNKTFAVDGTHASNESGMPASSNTIQFGTKGNVKYDNFKIYELTENPDYYEIPNTDKYFSTDGILSPNRDFVAPNLGEITVELDDEIDSASITSESVMLTNESGTISTVAAASGNKLTVSVQNQLRTNTVHWLTLKGIKTQTGKTAATKIFSFKTDTKRPIKELKYEQNFNDESNVIWTNLGYGAAPKTPGEWCFHGRTPYFEDNTSAEDKCIAVTTPQGDTLGGTIVTLPVALTGGTGVYEIDFDFYQNDGDTNFYLITNDKNPTLLAYPVEKGKWVQETWTIDLNNKKWYINGVETEFDNAMGNSISTLEIDNRPVGTSAKFDNFKIYEIKGESIVDFPMDSILISDKNDSIQTDLKAVDNKLGTIRVGFADIDSTTVTKDNIVVTGGGETVDYSVGYENDVITININQSALKLGTEYNVSFSGLKTIGGTTVADYDFDFTTAEKELVKAIIYEEDFNNVSGDTLNDWAYAYADKPEDVAWCFNGKKPALEDKGAGDYCVVAQNLNDTWANADLAFVTFSEALTNEGLGRYEITFDYWAAGNWQDAFYLYDNVTYPMVSYQSEGGKWEQIKMVLDLKNKVWYFNDYLFPDSQHLTSSFDTLMAKFYGTGEGQCVKFDNFKVYKIVEKAELSADTLTVNRYSFTNGNDEPISAIPTSGTVKATVNLTVNTPGEYNFTAIIATYTNEGLQNATFIPVSTTSGDTVKSIDNLSISVDSDTDFCQILIWDMANGNITPLTSAIPLTK